MADSGTLLVKETPLQFAIVQNKTFSYKFNSFEKAVAVDVELIDFLLQALF